MEVTISSNGVSSRLHYPITGSRTAETHAVKSLRPRFLAALKFSGAQASALAAVREFRGKQELFTRQTPELLETLRATSIVESSESSNRIEGVVARPGRVRALVLKGTAPKDRSEQEIAGYRDALALIHESADHMPLSINVIRQCHAMLFRYLDRAGGSWKLENNDVVERSPDGAIKRVRFRPVSAAQTPAAMDDLVRRYADSLHSRQQEPLVLVPLAVLDFLCVHPFADGNGRVARLLTLLLLYHADFRVGRYISLERIFEESKQTCYESLEASSKGWHQGRHNPFPWLQYFWGVLLRAYREFEERVRAVRSGKGSKTDLIRGAVSRRTKPFAISDIEGDCPGTSRDMVRVVLRQLRDSGTIELKGRGRGAKWLRVRSLSP
jgi:Fic family protein